MADNYRKPQRDPPALFFGRHFSWMARTAVKIAKELELTDQQFVKLVKVLIDELRETNQRFNRDVFVSHIRVAAAEIKREEALEGL